MFYLKMKKCHACLTDLTQMYYSNNQWSRKGFRRCKKCIASNMCTL